MVRVIISSCLAKAAVCSFTGRVRAIEFNKPYIWVGRVRTALNICAGGSVFNRSTTSPVKLWWLPSEHVGSGSSHTKTHDRMRRSLLSINPIIQVARDKYLWLRCATGCQDVANPSGSFWTYKGRPVNVSNYIMFIVHIYLSSSIWFFSGTPLTSWHGTVYPCLTVTTLSVLEHQPYFGYLL